MRYFIVCVAMLYALTAQGNVSDAHREGDFDVALCQALAEPTHYQTGVARTLDRLYQTENHFLFSRRELDPSLTLSPRALAGLKRLQEGLAAKGTHLIIMPVPTRGLVIPSYIPSAAEFDFGKLEYDYEKYLTIFRQNEIDVVDFSLMVGSGEPTLFYKRDFHWTPFGAHVSAQIVADHIKSGGLYSSLTRAEFVTRYDGVERFWGAMPGVFEKICGERFPIEYRRVYQTTKQSESSPAALFGDVVEEVVLIGTSFSAISHMNFPGFLSEAMEVEVHDYSVSGGNVYGAMYDYLRSENFHKSPPKILIWEFPIYQAKRFNGGDIYGMLLPAVEQRRCTDENRIFYTKRDMNASGGQLILNVGEQFKLLKHDDIFFQFELNDPDIVELGMQVSFVERRRVSMDAIKNARLENDGVFIVDTAHAQPDADLHFVSLALNSVSRVSQSDADASFEVEASVCRK